MNTKDYSEIAKIIKKTKRWSNELRAEELADYFEKESICKCGHTKERHSMLMFHSCVNRGCNCGQFKLLFNKQQFLKDCGVEE